MKRIWREKKKGGRERERERAREAGETFSSLYQALMIVFAR